MKCSKRQNIWHWWTIHSQIWERTHRNCIILMSFLFLFFSHLSQLDLFLSFFSNPNPLLSEPLIFSSLALIALPLSLTKPTHHCSSSASLLSFCYDLMGGLGNEWVGTVMCGFRWCGSVSTMVGGFGWADRWCWLGQSPFIAYLRKNQFSLKRKVVI